MMRSRGLLGLVVAALICSQGADSALHARCDFAHRQCVFSCVCLTRCALSPATVYTPTENAFATSCL